MLFVVYIKSTEGSYPTMIAIFLLKGDAKEFIKNNPMREVLFMEEVDSYENWYNIRQDLNKIVLDTEE